jgi:hypothetical protein
MDIYFNKVGIRMKKMIAFIIVALFLSESLSPAMAWHKGKEVTPYGDFCRLCGKYGTCDTPMTHEGAKKAVMDYYRKKGLNVILEKNRGRFIKARIMEKENLVDVIILDRRTGRIRSIY